MSAQARVFSGYRRLFRARRNLFEGDVQAMKESRVAIKQEFVKNRGAVIAGEQFEGLLTMVDEAEDMLRHGIARGNLNPGTGNYEIKIKPEHVEGVEHSNMEPITADVVSKMERPMVETTCQSKK
ncbi:predicted protein [Phaeodactylum tricornutum CCAP 1055/1]|uniref:Uncharacterized protein n=2 Tax=Phaeodactylum tricornutum TaxID=2850 RepID=B7G7P8_PHATC|nr:predicted protein [Phaeodactylum tricornutum CCAP 1055/1]EEC45271.1 predicted protein [Phaeodactylum tricornutum CCAP 1055/1]|eukprot:XP_002183053.1 predicted protein [Phaeodactylum tricornutum CCAP 1055/1]